MRPPARESPPAGVPGAHDDGPDPAAAHVQAPGDDRGYASQPSGPPEETRRLAYDPWIDDRAWTESWMSMNRTDHNPGSRLRQLLPGPEEAGQRHGVSGTRPHPIKSFRGEGLCIGS